MTPAVREARPEEYPAISALTVEAYRQYAAELGPHGWAEYQADLADIAGRAERGTILVAELEGRLAGVVTYYPPAERAEEGGWWWFPPDHASLRALAVDPWARGRGVGRTLTRDCIERARRSGAAGIGLNTLQLMQVAQALYERMGFRPQPEPWITWDGMEVLSYILPL